MNKQSFLDELRSGLIGLPQADVDERVGFYSEMIDDLMEEGFSEEDAVAKIGSVDDIVSQIIAETPLSKLAKEKVVPKRKLKAWEIVLLALGSPLWISLLAAVFSVIVALYAVLWSLVGCVWSVFAVFAACLPAGIALGVIIICQGSVISGIGAIGMGLLFAGLAIFAFFGCMAATKGTAALTKIIALSIKKCFVGKEKG